MCVSFFFFCQSSNRSIDDLCGLSAVVLLEITTCKVQPHSCLYKRRCCTDYIPLNESMYWIHVAFLEVNSSHVPPPLWSEPTTIDSASRVQMLKCVLLLYIWVQTSRIQPQTLKNASQIRATYHICYFFMTPRVDSTYFVCYINISVNIKCGIKPCFYLEILSSCINSNNMIYLRRHYIGIVAELRSISGILWHFVQHDRLFPLCIDDEWLYESLYSAIWNVHWKPQWELYILCEK